MLYTKIRSEKFLGSGEEDFIYFFFFGGGGGGGGAFLPILGMSVVLFKGRKQFE